MTDAQVSFYIFQIFKPPSLVLGGTRTHNLLIFGLTPKSSCLGAWEEDSCLYSMCVFDWRMVETALITGTLSTIQIT